MKPPLLPGLGVFRILHDDKIANVVSKALLVHGSQLQVTISQIRTHCLATCSQTTRNSKCHITSFSAHNLVNLVCSQKGRTRDQQFTKLWIRRISSVESNAGASKAKDSSSEKSEVKDTTRPDIKVKPVLSKSKGALLQPLLTTAEKRDLRPTNKLISPLRACHEYCLDPADLSSLPKRVRRSAFLGEPAETMYLLSDVHTVAIRKHGTIVDARRLALLRPGAGQPQKRSQVFASLERRFGKQTSLFRSSTGRVVLLAITLNGSLAIAKGLAWWFTSSHSMFAEMLHSCADTGNQIVVALGLMQVKKAPDPTHPYGYSNFSHITSLISGVGIFLVGTGLSWYEAVDAIGHSFDPYSMTWVMGVLGGSLICEGATLAYAIYVLRNKARREKLTVYQYIKRTDDPSLNVVLLEDAAAVMGLAVAAVCIGMSNYLQSVIPDATGSFLIGCLLAGSAYLIVRENTSYLMGKSIPASEKEALIKELEADVMVQAVKDVKATEMGDEKQRLKAEVDFEGRNVTRAYLGTQDLDKMLSEMQNFQSTQQVESFMLRHGERIVDRLGTEVDRIERNLKTKHPELRHIDLEAL